MQNLFFQRNFSLKFSTLQNALKQLSSKCSHQHCLVKKDPLCVHSMIEWSYNASVQEDSRRHEKVRVNSYTFSIFPSKFGLCCVCYVIYIKFCKYRHKGLLACEQHKQSLKLPPSYFYHKSSRYSKKFPCLTTFRYFCRSITTNNC